MSDLPGRVAKCASMADALETILFSGEKTTGVLRVISDACSGRISILDGHRIVGVTLTNSAEIGKDAFRKLLGVQNAVYQYLEADSADQIQSQSLRVEIDNLLGKIKSGQLKPLPIASPSSTITIEQERNDPSKVPFHIMFEGMTINREEQFKLQQFGRMRSSIEKSMFVAANPGFAELVQRLLLAREERKFLETRLGTNWAQRSQIEQEMQRSEFLQINPAFAAAMSTSLSEDQLQMFEDIRSQAVEKYVSRFVSWQREVLGIAQNDEIDLMPEQVDMLRRLYEDLATQEDREAFLLQNPAMADTTPVSKEVLWSPEERLEYASAANPLDAAGSLVTNEALDAIGLQVTAADHERTKHGISDRTARLAFVQAADDELADFDLTNFRSPRTIVSYLTACVFCGLMGVGVFQYVQSQSNADASVEAKELPAIVSDSARSEAPAVVSGGSQQGTAPSQGAGGSVQGSAPIVHSLANRQVPMTAQQSLREDAYRAIREGRLEDAAKFLTDYLQNEPKSTEMRILLMRVYIAMQQPDKAKQQGQLGVSQTSDDNERNAIQSVVDNL